MIIIWLTPLTDKNDRNDRGQGLEGLSRPLTEGEEGINSSGKG